MSIAHFIDHTMLKPNTTLGDIEKVCSEAIEFNFAAVCIPPYYVKDAAQLLAASKTRVATVIGFPFGYNNYHSKLAEVDQALHDGVHEVDVVMNMAAFKSNDMAYLEVEIGALTRLTSEGNLVIKIIIESGILRQEEIIKCCKLYQHYPIHFLKTSTGYADKGASVEAVQTMRNHLPSTILVKASGGIRDYMFANDLILAGASRLGCSASVNIVQEESSQVQKSILPGKTKRESEDTY